MFVRYVRLKTNFSVCYFIVQNDENLNKTKNIIKSQLSEKEFSDVDFNLISESYSSFAKAVYSEYKKEKTDEDAFKWIVENNCKIFYEKILYKHICKICQE